MDYGKDSPTEGSEIRGHHPTKIVFKNLQWDREGIDVDCKRLNNLRFTTHTIPMSSDFEELKTMLKTPKCVSV